MFDEWAEKLGKWPLEEFTIYSYQIKSVEYRLVFFRISL